MQISDRQVSPKSALTKSALTKSAWTALALAALLGGLAASSQAQTKLTDRSQITGGTVIDWNQLGPDGATAPNPFTATANDGTQAIVSQDGGPDASFFKFNEGQGVEGNFALGDGLLYNGLVFDGLGGPITLSFANGVSAVGTQFLAVNYGPFMAQVQTFDQFGNVLATFTEDGASNSKEDNSAIFLGVADPTADIFQVTFSAPNAVGGPNNFLINQVSLIPAPVPEASTTASLSLLLALGCGGVIVAARRKKSVP